jgi:hypothetical protein
MLVRASRMHASSYPETRYPSSGNDTSYLYELGRLRDTRIGVKLWKSSSIVVNLFSQNRERNGSYGVKIKGVAVDHGNVAVHVRDVTVPELHSATSASRCYPCIDPMLYVRGRE